jgi:PAS domain S-box-containing protein
VRSFQCLNHNDLNCGGCLAKKSVLVAVQLIESRWVYIREKMIDKKQALTVVYITNCDTTKHLFEQMIQSLGTYTVELISVAYKTDVLVPYQDNPPDIVFMDLCQGNDSHFEKLDAVHQQMPLSVPLVVLLDGFDDEAGLQALERGADAYILRQDMSLRFIQFIIRMTLEQTKLLRAVRGSERKLASVLDTAVEGIVIINQEGIISLINHAVTRLFGFSEKELVGKPITRIIPNTVAEHHQKYIENYLETGEQRVIGIGRECTGCRKDGSEFPIYLSVSEIKENGKSLFTGMVRDITQQKQAEEKLTRQKEKLERSNTELDQFAQMVSHDLKSPLHVIHGVLQLIQVKLSSKLDIKVRQLLENALDTVLRMDNMITQLLELSRTGDMKHHFRELNVQHIVEIALKNLGDAVESNEATIRYDSLPYIIADELQLTRVFQNLLSNALKYRSNKAPQISIRAEKQPDQWLFSVSDNGVGISEQDQRDLFTMFKRSNTTKHISGSGIGLAACRRIIERVFQGKIWVKSDVGSGSTFYFTIPLANSTGFSKQGA